MGKPSISAIGGPQRELPRLANEMRADMWDFFKTIRGTKREAPLRFAIQALAQRLPSSNASLFLAPQASRVCQLCEAQEESGGHVWTCAAMAGSIGVAARELRQVLDRDLIVVRGGLRQALVDLFLDKIGPGDSERPVPAAGLPQEFVAGWEDLCRADWRLIRIGILPGTLGAALRTCIPAAIGKKRDQVAMDLVGRVGQSLMCNAMSVYTARVDRLRGPLSGPVLNRWEGVAAYRLGQVAREAKERADVSREAQTRRPGLRATAGMRWTRPPPVRIRCLHGDLPGRQLVGMG